MDKRPVVFLDSGLGSLPYAGFFHSRNKGECVVCIGDSANFPYGTKSKETLVKLVLSLTDKILARYDPKIIAVACNTISVSALEALREHVPLVPVVGTVPAIKPAVLASRKRRVGVLGTQRTIEDPYIFKLAAQYGKDCAIAGIAAPELVEFAEHRYAASNSAERLEAVRPYIEKFRSAGADAVVLACTHFLLLRDEFAAAAGTDMGIHDSVEGVARRVEFFLDRDNRRLRTDPGAGECTPRIAVTGEEAMEPHWEQLCRRFGFMPQGNL